MSVSLCPATAAYVAAQAGQGHGGVSRLIQAALMEHAQARGMTYRPAEWRRAGQ